MEQGATEFRTLREGIELGYTFCANADMVPGLIAQFPEMAQLLVNSPRGGSLAAMDNNVCYGALIHEDYWRASRLFGDVSQCRTKARLAETVTVEANTIPVRGEIERAVSTLIARDKEAGVFTRLRNEALLNYTYDRCAERSTTTRRRQFDITDLGGPMVFLTVTSLLSVIVTRIGKAAARRTEQLKKSIDTDGDGVVTTLELASAALKSGRRSFAGVTSATSATATQGASTLTRHTPADAGGEAGQGDART